MIKIKRASSIMAEEISAPEVTYADMHIHSCFSDGSKTPEEILAEAAEKNIGVIAITDHDVLEGAEKLLSLKTGIKCISGVELTAVEGEQSYHILGYGCDLGNQEFRRFAENSRRCLDLVSVQLIEKMKDDYESISLEDYNAYSYDVKKGGWKALHYFIERGITQSLFGALRLYAKYGQGYDTVGFPTASEVCRAIHEAGGKAVLAHPGKVIGFNEAFGANVERALAFGLDGIECYYPYKRHGDEITAICLGLCKKYGLLITSGSDSHGDFEIENTPIGIMKITYDKLYLGDLLR